MLISCLLEKSLATSPAFESISCNHPMVIFVQYVPVTERRREEPPEAALAACKASVRHGPIFGCIVCMRACFLSDVEEVEKVKTAQLVRFLDPVFLLRHKSLFHQLGRNWICKVCKASITAGNMPKLASMNSLKPTWAFQLSSPWDIIPKLTPLEKEVLALKQIFCQVEGLRVGVLGVGGPEKTLFLLSADPEQEFQLPDIVALHAQPPHYKLQLRKELTLAGQEFLLSDHPLYKTSNKDGAKEHLRNQLNHYVGVLPGVVEDWNANVVQQGETQEELDWFSIRGPKLAKLNSTVLPWKKPELPQAASTLEQMMPDLLAQVAGLLDMRDEAGPAQPREVELTLAEWLLQRINHIHRGGLVNDPLLLFALLHVTQTRRMKPLIDRCRKSFHLKSYYLPAICTNEAVVSVL